MKITKILCYIILALTICSCNNNNDDDNKDQDNEIIPKGNRQMGIHVTESSSTDFEASFQRAMDAGMDCIPQVFYWNDLEDSSGYDSQGLMEIVNLFYPAYDMPVSLCITPIAAVNRAVPSDLENVNFDDSLMIQRYKNLLDTFHDKTPNLDLRFLLIGNEVDLYLSNHSQEWNAYKSFFDQVKTHAKALWGNELKVGVETTLGSMIYTYPTEVEMLNENADMICFTYYPLNPDFTMASVSSIESEIDKVIEKYSARDIFLEECGYATSPDCNSSEALQSDFFVEMFHLWDKYADRLIYIGFLWLHDLSESQAQFYVEQYQMSGHPYTDNFKEYLRTLGVITHDGTEKEGFFTIQAEAEKRGW